MPSSVLDPRIGYEAFLADCGDDKALQDHVKATLNKLRVYYAKNYAPDPSAPAAVLSHINALGPSSSPQRNFLERYKHGKSHKLQNELEAYLQLQPEDWKTCDPVQWWASRRSQFPNLSRLARDILSIPGT